MAYRDGRIYKRWHNMRQRCENPEATTYELYGARGIAVCEHWQDFDIFHKWFTKEAIKFYFQNPGKKPEIDRIDPSKGYSPKNCRLIDSYENKFRSTYPGGLTPLERETRDLNQMNWWY